jgi:hypothetical protein
MPLVEPNWSSPGLAVALLLLAGHVLADFVFQTRWMVEKKALEPRALLAHALAVFALEGASALWFAWSVRALLLVAAIALAHLLIDRAKALLEARFPARAVACFGLDQAAHLAVLLVALWAWPEATFAGDPAPVARVALVVSVYGFNVNGGSGLVNALLGNLRREPADPVVPAGSGRLIGILERLLVVTLVWRDQWGAVGLVLTAKSIARYKRLEEQDFAEAYLIGTMTSVTVAVVSGLCLNGLLG